MSPKSYYCTKCGHTHKYTSKIGLDHLKYISETPTSESISETPLVEESSKAITVEEIEPVTPIQKVVSTKKKNRISKFFQDYLKSYKNGVARFGIWWSVFQISIWSIALIFLLMAGIILIIYLPKIEMIYWDLR